MGKHWGIVPVLLLVAAISAPSVQANEITYTITGTANGAFTLTFTGDTGNVELLPGDSTIQVIPVTGTFSFNSGALAGSFSSTDAAGSPLVVGWDSTTSNVGFAYLSLGSSGGDPAAVSCNIGGEDPSYNGLNSTPGPLPCTPGGVGGNFATNLGSPLDITNTTSATDVTFSAVVATPEPSSLLLLASGLVGLMGMGLPRKRLA